MGRWSPRLDISVCESQSTKLIMSQLAGVGGGRPSTLKATGGGSSRCICGLKCLLRGWLVGPIG